MIVTLLDGTTQEWPVGCATVGYGITRFTLTAEEAACVDAQALTMWLYHSVLPRLVAS